MIIKIKTTNTSTGNPRHAFIEYDKMGLPIKSWEIGYQGLAVLANRQEEGYFAPEIKVSPVEYKRLISEAKRIGASMEEGQTS